MTKMGNSLCIYSDEEPGLCDNFRILGEPSIIQSWPRAEKVLILNDVPVVYFARTNGGVPIYWTQKGDVPAGSGNVKLVGSFSYKKKDKIEPPTDSNALKRSYEFDFKMLESTFSIWATEYGYSAPATQRDKKTAPPTHKSEMYPDRFGSKSIIGVEYGKLVDWVWLTGFGKDHTEFMGGRVTSYDGMRNWTKAVKFSVELRAGNMLVVSASAYEERTTSIHPGGFYTLSNNYISGLSIEIRNCLKED